MRPLWGDDIFSGLGGGRGPVAQAGSLGICSNWCSKAGVARVGGKESSCISSVCET